MSAFFGAAFFVNGVIVPFFPVVLSAKGLTGEEIAFVLATPYAMRLFTMPFISGMADRSSDRRRVVLWLVLLALSSALALGAFSLRIPIMAMGAILLVLSTSVGPLADAIAILMDRNGLGDYGRMRLWGSASFIAGNLVGGAVMEGAGVGTVYFLILAGFVLSAASTFIIPPAPPRGRDAPVATLTILRRPAFLGVLFGHALIQSGHAAFYGFGTLIWQQRGYDDTTIGIFWAVGVIAEIALFSVAGKLLRNVSPLALMVVGGVVGILRWYLFTVDMGPVATGVLQLLHAGSFGMAHMGFMRFNREMVPEQRVASAQGTYQIFNGISMALATALTGRLWPAVGEDCFFAMIAFCVLGLVVLGVSRSGVSRLPVMSAPLPAA